VILASQLAKRLAQGVNLTENKFKNGPKKTTNVAAPIFNVIWPLTVKRDAP
jgi:hypothetical protein